jgi:formylglycine-generating enzyme required for sulfatase activity
LQEVPLPSRFVDSTPPEELNEFAWPRIAPEDLDQGRDRTIFGEEMVALTAARAAVSRSMASPDRHAYLDTLAWALFANGQDEDAQARSAEALAAAPPGSRAEYERYQQTLTRAIAQRKASLQSAEQRLLQLDRECATRRTWSFTRNEEGEAARFLHDALVGHLRELEKLEGRRRTDVARRLSWARQVGAASASHPLARHSWAEARAAIHAADGTTASRLYASKHIPIPDSGWHGLVPIGRNPATGLWEFYDLRSAWDGEQKIAEIEIPKHAEDGSIQVRADTGIVFVLVPGGSFWMGSQQDDPQAPNYDPERAPSETLHEVALSPYLLARHELTRSQWTRLTDEPAGYWEDGVRYNGDATPIGPTHPAVEIDWFRADLWLRRHAMCLPTEAQWEHGCRAGTTTVFSSGSSPSSLQGYANVHDLTSNEQFSRWGEPAPIRDGYRAISPVGSYLANQFGMHDMHGNVWEWCQDLEGRYGSERPGDGLRTTSSSSERIDRGGSYNFPPMHARSAHRTEMSPASRINILGLRACRLLPP